MSILVANAGVGRRIRDVADIGEDDWDEMMEINSRSQFVVTKAALAGMRAQKWGRVVLMGSIASRGSGLNGCHYAASKGALTAMGQNLARLVAPEGVTVNIVSQQSGGDNRWQVGKEKHSILTTDTLASSCHDWRDGNDSYAKGRVRATSTKHTKPKKDALDVDADRRTERGRAPPTSRP